MADQQQMTISEALNQIKIWIQGGEKEKAKQGLQEVLEFDPANAEAKKMLAELEMPTAPPRPTSPVASSMPSPVASSMPSSTEASKLGAPTALEKTHFVPSSSSGQKIGSTPSITQLPTTKTPPQPISPQQTPPQATPPQATSTQSISPQQTPPVTVVSKTELNQEKIKKIAMIGISALILVGGIYFLYSTFFGNAETEKTPRTEETSSPSRETPSNKVKRR